MSGLGHLAAGLALKPAAPEVPLWALLAAGELNDILYFALTQAGIERAGQAAYSLDQGVVTLSASFTPFSHGLAGSFLLTAAAALLARLAFRRWRAAAAVGLAVLSHFLLDFLMHAGLPIGFSASPSIGLGLERSGAGLIFMTALDLVLLAGGMYLYLNHRRRSAGPKTVQTELEL